MNVEAVLRRIERQCREDEATYGPSYRPRSRGGRGEPEWGAIAEARGVAATCREIRALCRRLRHCAETGVWPTGYEHGREV